MLAPNYLPTRNMAESITGCCPPFVKAEWDSKTFTFDQKLFIKVSTRSIFHIPLNMNSVMKKVSASVEGAGATSPDALMLSYEVSPWKAEHYLAVSEDVDGFEIVKMSGTFMTKVFDGPYKNMRNWYEELIKYVKSEGMDPIKIYFSYTFCPKCAKAYGHNYVVGFAQVN